MSRAVAETPTSCPLCGGASTGEGCRLCGGLGVVDAAARERWRSSRRARSTSTAVSLADIAAGVVDRLRARAVELSILDPDREAVVEAAIEGQLLLSVIAGWRLMPADGPTRAAAYGRVGEWQRRALEALTRRP